MVLSWEHERNSFPPTPVCSRSNSCATTKCWPGILDKGPIYPPETSRTGVDRILSGNALRPPPYDLWLPLHRAWLLWHVRRAMHCPGRPRSWHN